MKLPTIPLHWSWKTVSNLGRVGRPAVKAGPFGSALKKSFYVQSGFRVYGQEQVIAGDLSVGDYYIDKEKFESLSSCEVKAGDILVSLVGTFGKVLVVPNVFEPGIINPRLVRLSLDPNLIDPYFFSRFFRSPLAQTQMQLQSHGGTMDILNAKNISELFVPLPPLEEQRRIATILDKADAVRRKRKEAIALTEELLRSAFLEMFGDPVTNPKGWEVKELEEITSHITDGVHFRPNYTKSGIPFISVKDITTGRLLFEDCKFISEEDHRKFTKRCKPELGDILYTKVGATYGRPALVDVSDDFSLYVSVCLIKPLRNIVRPQFLKQIMATPALKRQADRSIKGIGVPDLHLNMIKKFLVPVPNLDIQDEFLKRTEKIQKCLSVSESSLTKLDDLFNSLLQRAFRGEL